ncbi:hypothetical protein [Hymenobacter sp. BRD67]|uniref:hypothetical protein n=1 Tax=Hymenobacter sp. BRD67 TaxID=2675877 RepID=UPI001567C523|nr:hypothetical protein [Hymenobacter sp. BRD67]QKG52898.1 hypothetical protein GKZ67_10140 [Hymenobacter sp. BRD67]
MNEQFDITLWNRWLFGWLVVPMMLAVLAGIMAGWDLLLHQAGGEWGAMLLGAPVLFGCVYGLERLTC